MKPVVKRLTPSSSSPSSMYPSQEHQPEAGPSRLRQFVNSFKRQLSRPSLLSSSNTSEDETVLEESWADYTDRMSHFGAAGADAEPDLVSPEGFVAGQMRGDIAPDGDPTAPPQQSEKTRTTQVHKLVLDSDFERFKQGEYEHDRDADGDASSFDGSVGAGQGHRPVGHAEGEDGRRPSAVESFTRVHRAATRLMGKRGPGGGGGGGGPGTTMSRQSEHTARQRTRTGRAWRWLSRTVWPAFKYFVDMSFSDRKKERAYLREEYHGQRQLAIASAAFLCLAWVVSDATISTNYSAFDWYAWVGIYGALTLPLLPMVCLNAQYYFPWFYQVFLLCAVWALPDIGMVTMWRCGVYSLNMQCDNRSYFIAFAAAVANPTLALLSLSQNRLVAIFGAIQLFCLQAGLLFNRIDIPNSFYRDCTFGLLFNGFIVGISFLRERSSRQLFEVRQQLKVQYRATQRAQLMEKKAGDLKKRFVSYIFHEVRVPLNTALLAVQNLEGEQAFKHLPADQEELVAGLSGSLGMMEKVLNDVLSFNRFESGRLSLCTQPFDLARVIDLTACAHMPAAIAKGLSLKVDIDEGVRRVNGQGVVLGDEMRLRQLLSNLVSNAMKFTSRGSVAINARLLFCSEPSTEADGAGPATAAVAAADVEMAQPVESNGTESTYWSGRGDVEKQADGMPPSPAKQRWAIVRLEVQDTGVGLRAMDVMGDRLFSPYVQTELGRRQGGKGTGLGLALVYQIVQLSKGRLGVDSVYGQGSTFWIEMPFRLPGWDVHPTAHTPSILAGRPATPGLGMTRTGTSRPLSLEMLRGGAGGMSSASVLPPRRLDADSALSLVRQATRASMRSVDQIAVDQAEEHVAQQAITAASLSAIDLPLSQQTGGSTVAGLSSPSSSPVQVPMPVPVPRRIPSYGSVPHLRPLSSTSTTTTASPRPASPLPRTISQLNTQPYGSAPRSPDPGSTSVQGPGSPASVPSPASPAPDTRTTLNVLIVDDDKLTRTLMCRMLKRLGHTVTQAEDGLIAKAKVLAPDASFDVIFLDNQMPHMSGVEVARHLRGMDPPHGIYIAGCTGNALKEDQEEYRAAGADVILTKPIKQAAVEEVCRLALERALAREAEERTAAKVGAEDSPNPA